MKHRSCICFIIAALSLLLCLSAFAETGITPSRQYQQEDQDELPEVLNVGYPLQCGDFSLMIMGQPVVTKSSVGMVAELDMNFLIIRIGFTNLSDRTIGWMMPDSFSLTETYNSRRYGTYRMEPIISAKVAAGFKLPAFFTPIEPGKTLQTPLVFSVYPGAQSWVLTFTPRTIGEETSDAEPVSFRLPAAILQ